ncbi:MAG: TIGR04282 family arsenosugar biosynthesis glycosyltransferase [Algoriphagus sp.]|uniref:TIGR04282 family arsenosugar biosynthesis glycosyltransferase n=1 Tax=Algoriphagus sp. TaxID=1872435 RepID=UPI0026023A83|nr:TIGR04282 family arsenosugar biosynthesis glycosyltransferase [Algoriphagus sp.]MDG1277213.1 TIGR04282 family arsenosugar biosynthesis glycosyltransferase [Algoriphagus sp.]
MNKNALIIFQKNEIPGKVKTRLAASIGDESALKIYRILIQHTHSILKEIVADQFIFYSDFIPEIRIESGRIVHERIQTGKDLGERMRNAFETVFSEGYDHVVIIGTDCVDLKPAHIQKAFKKLSQNDAVLGPALDGGYYLLGLKKLIPEIFEEIDWSTNQVLNQTKSKLQELNFSIGIIDTLSDIDNIADWEKVKGRFDSELNSKH